MAEEFKSEKLSVCTRRKIGNSQIKNTVVLNAPENDKIKKVLSFVALPIVEQTEVVANEVKISGYVKYKSLVCLESGEFLELTQNVPFNTGVENAIVESGMVVEVDYNILTVVNRETAGKIDRIYENYKKLQKAHS